MRLRWILIGAVAAILLGLACVDLWTPEVGSAIPAPTVDRHRVDLEVEPSPPPPRVEMAVPSPPSPEELTEQPPDTKLSVIILTGKGAPVSGVNCRIVLSSTDAGIHGIHLRRTDADGRFECSGLPVAKGYMETDRGTVHAFATINQQTVELRVSLPFTLRVAGRVTDTNGHPIAGAEIYMGRPARVSQKCWQRKVTSSDKAGRFSVICVAEYSRFGARAGGFEASHLYSAQTTLSRDGLLNITIQLRRGGSTLRGRVIDQSGSPLCGVWVRVGTRRTGRSVRDINGIARRTWSSFRTTTLVDGSFEILGLQSGATTVHVSSRSHAPKDVQCELALLKDGHLEIRLVKGGSLSGTITTDRGEPIPDASVDIGNLRGAWFRGDVEPRTNASGQYQLKGLLPGATRICVRAKGFDNENRTVVISEGARHELSLMMSRKPEITGRVVDANGQGVSGMEVCARSIGERRRTGWTTSDRMGLFQLPTASNMMWQMNLRVPGSPMEMVAGNSPVPSGASDLKISYTGAQRASCRIVGRFVESTGVPIRNAWLQIGRVKPVRMLRLAGHTHADNGRFEIGPLKPGRYTVHVHPVYPWQVDAELGPYTLTENETKDLGEVVLVGGVIEIKHRSATGAANLRVRAVVSQDGRVVRSSPLDASGTTTITSPEGQLVLSIRGRECLTQKLDVKVVPGKTSRVAVTLQPGVPVRLSMKARNRSLPRETRVSIKSGGGFSMETVVPVTPGHPITLMINLPLGKSDITLGAPEFRATGHVHVRGSGQSGGRADRYDLILQ